MFFYAITACLLFQYFNFCSSVLGPALRCFIIRYRYRKTVSFGGKPVGVDSFGDKIVPNGISPVFGKNLVALGRSNVIGMTLYLDALIILPVQVGHQFIEYRERFG